MSMMMQYLKNDVDLLSLLSDPFGFISDMDECEVVLRIDGDQAIFERAVNWPESTTLEDGEDGSLIIKTRTHSYFDLKRWILERTPHVSIISPLWLKDDIRETLEMGIKRI